MTCHSDDVSVYEHDDRQREGISEREPQRPYISPVSVIFLPTEHLLQSHVNRNQTKIYRTRN